MNYRTMLLATAAALFSSQAMAADLTNPFFTPGQGQITSDTNVGYYRVKAKHDGGVAEGYYAAETLEYGITDKFSINGTIANMFELRARIITIITLHIKSVQNITLTATKFCSRLRLII